MHHTSQMPPLSNIDPDLYEPDNINHFLDLFTIPSIYPCSTTTNSHGLTQLSPFHLLTCGHMVVVSAADRRCAPNCYHAGSAAPVHATSKMPEPAGYKHTDTYVFHEDILPC